MSTKISSLTNKSTSLDELDELYVYTNKEYSKKATYTDISDIMYNELNVDLEAIKTNIYEIAKASLSDITECINTLSTQYYDLQEIKEASQEVIDTYYPLYSIYEDYMKYETGRYPYSFATELSFTWEEISSKLSEGDFTNLKIGDYKYISVGGNTYTMRIAARDPYLNSTESLHHLDFVSDELYVSSGTPSAIRSTITSAIENESYTDDFRDYVVTKYMYLDSLSSTTSMGTYWVPTAKEVFGNGIETTSSVTLSYGASLYPLFANRATFRLKCPYGSSTYSSWLLGDAAASSTYIVVSSNGILSTCGSSSSIYAPICFRISY